MIIRNHNNKTLIEVRDNKLIIVRFNMKSVIDISKIRGAYIDDMYLLKILYGNRVKVYNIANISEEDKKILPILMESLNKEGIVFSGEGNNFLTTIFILPIFIFNVLVAITNNKEIGYIIFTVILLVLVIGLCFFTTISSNTIIYDYNNKMLLVRNYWKTVKSYYINDKLKVTYEKYDNVYRVYTDYGVKIVPATCLYPEYYNEKFNELVKLKE